MSLNRLGSSSPDPRMVLDSGTNSVREDGPVGQKMVIEKEIPDVDDGFSLRGTTAVNSR